MTTDKIKNLIITLFVIMLSVVSKAGVETDLVLNQYRECWIRIFHDATPSSQIGTIVFKVYQVRQDVHYPCDITSEEAFESLDQGFKRLQTKRDLKSVTSISIGRLIEYPWARDFLIENAKAAASEKLTYQQVEELVYNSMIVKPFKDAITNNDHQVNGASCEKIMFYANGAPKDALCYLLITNIQKESRLTNNKINKPEFG